MATFSRPGVYIQEVALPQSVTPANNSNAVGAFAGALSQGPVDAPVLVTTWNDFVKTFGGLNDSYPTTWAAYNFFANGGRNLYVKRVVGSGASVGSVTITDSASATAFKVKTVNPGTWASNYSVQVVSAGVSTRFGLNLYSTSIVNGASTTNLVESYTDLSMNASDKNYVLAVVNAFSKYIKITDLDSAKTPAVTLTPAVLSSGAADGAALAATDYYNLETDPISGAWTTFDAINSPIVMYAPDAAYQATGTLASQIHADAVLYASTRSDAFVVVDTTAGNTVSEAQAEVDATVSGFGAGSTGNIAAAYYPWVNIPDPTKTVGVTRLQAPGAAVVGQYLATDASRGPAKTPAGFNNQIALAVSTEHSFTNAELDTINVSSNPINAIRQVPGAGIVIMGGRTLDNTPNNRYINIRRSLIYIEKQISDLTSFALFENNDSRLWSQIRTVLNSFLLTYWQSGGLRGSNPGQAYFVKCDDTTTSFADLQAGRVNVEVGVALEYPAEFVVVKLSQLTGNASA